MFYVYKTECNIVFPTVLIPTMWSILHKVQLHNHWNQSDNGNTGQCQFQYSLEVRLLLIYITLGSITVRIRVSS